MVKMLIDLTPEAHVTLIRLQIRKTDSQRGIVRLAQELLTKKIEEEAYKAGLGAIDTQQNPIA